LLRSDLEAARVSWWLMLRGFIFAADETFCTLEISRDVFERDWLSSDSRVEGRSPESFWMRIREPYCSFYNSLGRPHHLDFFGIRHCPAHFFWG
jgi:hypothetical protein